MAHTLPTADHRKDAEPISISTQCGERCMGARDAPHAWPAAQPDGHLRQCRKPQGAALRTLTTSATKLITMMLGHLKISGVTCVSTRDAAGLAAPAVRASI
eukprot:25846-Chlamydomonas_euryale.AAC.1